LIFLKAIDAGMKEVDHNREDREMGEANSSQAEDSLPKSSTDIDADRMRAVTDKKTGRLPAIRKVKIIHGPPPAVLPSSTAYGRT
jgi:hypothetical protein